jgi:pimeloyl-ACP methyl ester carboxylesterase
MDKTLLVTVYEPENRNNWLVLYLHGNSSSRLEATSIIKFLPFRYSLAAFDFIGCGHNLEADTISLGHREAEQVESVVTFLEAARFKVILWGRSMGAATALKFGRSTAIVADSSFKSFRSLCKQVAKKNAPKYVPTCLVSCLFPCVFSKLRADIR